MGKQIELIFDWIRKLKIKNRLLITFIIISVVPILFIGLYGHQKYISSLVNKLSQSTHQTIKLINGSINKEIEQYEYLADWLMLDETVQQGLLEKDDISLMERGELQRTIEQTIFTKGMYSQYIKNIIIWDNNNQIFYELGYDRIIENYLKYIELGIEESFPNNYWDYIKTYRDTATIVMGKNIFKEDFSLEKLGKLSILLDEKIFSKMLFEDIDMGEGTKLFLINKEGKIMSSKDPSISVGSNYLENNIISRIQENCIQKIYYFDETIEKEKYLISYMNNELTGWYLVCMVPFTYINSETIDITNSILSLIMIIIISCLIILMVIYKSMMNPINKMIQVCRNIPKHNLDNRIEDKCHDEVGYLAHQFDDMLDEIGKLLIVQEEDQKKKRELEIQMLQYQINPHFLFNTLNTLKWIAIMNQDHIVSDGISSLSELLKGTLINKNEYITIREEIDNLNNYFKIQKLRYADSFEVVYEVEDKLLDCMILKFVLQPLAENAIIHGTYENNKKIVIEVNVHIAPDQNIEIQINDNGRGFEVIDEKRKLTGIGVSNVDERIKLSFNKEYGVFIKSIREKGTWCRIIIPKMEGINLSDE